MNSKVVFWICWLISISKSQRHKSYGSMPFSTYRHRSSMPFSTFRHRSTKSYYKHTSINKFGQELIRQLEGEVFAKESIGYEKRRLVHNGLCTHIYPDWIVVPESTEDVATVVTLTNKYNVPISVRSGGHSFTCSSTRQGKTKEIYFPK